MEAVRVQQVVVKDGEVLVRGIPYKKGQLVDIIVLSHPPQTMPSSHLTVRQLRQSGLIGLWKERQDIQDSAAYARRLREQAQKRGDINYDFVR
ncbi:MAG: hypothetical protein V3T96_01640 [Thermodesulfobacteriota bacterium]|jgi:hypothetical protein